jgi:hypothetical protein
LFKLILFDKSLTVWQIEILSSRSIRAWNFESSPL